ncbi:phospholipase D-like domain-containing protein [Calidithermus timidus]|jgi:phosphatidylserine/phosphatidylglycerophosphate/cardiolipin synthase-like enzyme|uniref:phospholipase D-like domain-containing protein n=1 Tax=Calidithermus timidus TaxID=307124 RepID=UPI00037BF690|nr:phospholipase D-like domain-containing protein [Calidithermus timidus]
MARRRKVNSLFRSKGRSSEWRLLLLLLLLAGAWLYQWWQKNQPPATVAPVPGGAQLELYLMPGDGAKAKARLIGLIGSARRQVEVAAFELDDREIGRALLEAAARGVRVRLYTDRDYRREARESLQASGRGGRERCEEVRRVAVCYDDREALMHHKFVLIDDVGVWSGSTNLTWNAFARNNENSLFFPLPGLVQAYRGEFEALWSGRAEGRGLPASFRIGTLEGQVFFSPAGGTAGRAALLKTLRQARKEVLIAAYVLTDRGVLEELEALRRRGVRVRVVIDARNLVNSLDEEMKRAGIAVRKDGNPYTQHNKVIVLDDTWVVTGSYNFSASAYRSNNENLLILKSPELAARYRKELEAIWRAGEPL